MEFKDLHRENFTVSDIIVLPQYWKDGKSFSYLTKPRPDHGLSLYTACRARYTDESGAQVTEISPGSIFYAPKGARYRAEFYDVKSDGAITDILINFLIFDEDGEELSLSENVSVFPAGVAEGLLKSFSEILSGFKSASFPKAKIKAILYNMLSDISLGLDKACRSEEASLSPVKSAVDYISENYLSGELKVSDLARLCHMSDANFRRVFAKYTGLSPKSYILKLRLDLAAVLLRRGNISVTETARYVGFDDVSYFVRIYKKHMGHTPGETEK